MKNKTENSKLLSRIDYIFDEYGEFIFAWLGALVLVTSLFLLYGGYIK